jgi:hypothetical protein
MKTWDSGGIAPPFLTSAVVGGELSASRPGRFIPEDGAPGTHWIGDRVCPWAGLYAMKRKMSSPCRISNPGRSARRYSDLAIPVPRHIQANLTKSTSDTDGVRNHITHEPQWMWLQSNTRIFPISCNQLSLAHLTPAMSILFHNSMASTCRLLQRLPIATP